MYIYIVIIQIELYYLKNLIVVLNSGFWVIEWQTLFVYTLGEVNKYINTIR